MIELQQSLFICLGTPVLLSLTCECQSGYGAPMYASNADAYATTSTLPPIKRPDEGSNSGYGLGQQENDGYGETMRFHTVRPSGAPAAQPGLINDTVIAKQLGGEVTAPQSVIRKPSMSTALRLPRSTTTMAGSSDSWASSSSSFAIIIPSAIGLICLCSVVALGVFFVFRYRTQQKTAIECEHAMRERQNNSQFKTAFEWDALAIDGVKVGNWREFRTAAERILPGVRQDFLYSREEFLDARRSVQLCNDDDFRTRVWME